MPTFNPLLHEEENRKAEQKNNSTKEKVSDIVSSNDFWTIPNVQYRNQIQNLYIVVSSRIQKRYRKLQFSKNLLIKFGGVYYVRM